MPRLTRFIYACIVGLGLFCRAADAADPPLVMGIFPRVSAVETTRMYQPLAQHLSAVIGREVQLETAKDFESFWNGVTSGRYDLVHLPPYQYMKAHKEHAYQVILKNVEQGQSTLAGALVVRADSPFHKVADLKGKKIVFGGDRNSVQTFVGPAYLLKKNGLKKGDYEEEYAKNPPNAAIAVFHKQADAAGAGDRVLGLPALAKQVNPQELRYLAVGERLPHLPWAVKSAMTPKLRQQIQAEMIRLNTTEPGKGLLATLGIDAFVAATDKEYDRYRQVVREVLGEEF